MSEGPVHNTLVSSAYEFFISSFGSELDILLRDAPGLRAADKPPKIGRYTPDVWGQSRRRILIGEAKTFADLDTPHTANQLGCFLEYVVGSPPGSTLVVCVPTFAMPRAKQILRSLGRAPSEIDTYCSVLGVEVALEQT